MASSTNMDEQKSLKIGVLISDDNINYYLNDIIDWIKQQPDMQLSHCIIHQANPPSSKSSWITKALSSLKKNGILISIANLLFLCIQTLEKYHLSRKDMLKKHCVHYKLKDLDLTTYHATPIVSRSGLVHQFTEKDLLFIQDLQLDLLICFGGPILRGKILHLAKFGIISLHHGDNDKYRGHPAGFWEVYEKNPVSGFIIQQLNDEIDNGAVFEKGLLNTRAYWLLNQAMLYIQANYYFKAFLKQLARTQHLPQPLAPRPYSHRLYHKPNIRECAHYLKLLATHYLRNRHRSGKWHVAFLHQHWSEAILWKGIDFPKIPGIGIADPFLYSKDGKHYCFVEEIDMKIDRGSIAIYQIENNDAIRIGTVLKENFNLSYPYIFEYEGRLFMMPETFEINEIRIYECVDFPLKWEYKHTLINNISAADSTLIENNGEWWLLTNLDHSHIADHCAELSIYYAKSPLASKWTPHPNNPIYIDAFHSRNGGFFKVDNKMYRVSQSQGINNYGESIFINEITKLDRQDFKEYRITHLLPRFKPNILGIHHFHTNGSLTVFDYFESN